MLGVAVFSWNAAAKVDRIEITERAPFADAAQFGDAGAYEKIRGRAYFSVDPRHRANARIVDLDKAPRDARGRVLFVADFLMLRPVDPARGSGTLFYDVPNRGGLVALGQLNEAAFNNNPSTVADAGNGFLLRQGMTLLWSAWAFDVEPAAGDPRLIFAAPVASEKGKAITGRVAYEIIVDQPAETANFAGARAVAYRPALTDDAGATLTRRASQKSPSEVMPRERWSFVAPGDGKPLTELRLEGGFQPGYIYEVVYLARDPVVVGLGLVAIRDLLSYVRQTPFEGAPPPAAVIAYGVSQSGRVLQHMLLEGLHVDEAGKPVFDGAMIHVAGAGKGSFNHRFAMPTRHFSMLQEHGYPTDFFPFTTVPEVEGGRRASVLDRAKEKHAVPKVFYTNTSAEYWSRSASLTHTTPDGKKDLAVDPAARIYALLGAQHYVGRARTRGAFAQCVDPLNHQVAMRALVVAMTKWVRAGTPPPPSVVPRIGEGTLGTFLAYQAAFPAIPGIKLPRGPLEPPRLNLGPRFEKFGIVDLVPAVQGAPYVALVPQPDSDGLDRGGVAFPDMLVPLGTRTGWNMRAPSSGFPDFVARFDGSFVPFARTRAERDAAGDPRPSIAERYADREAYLARYREAAGRLMHDGFLVPDELEEVVDKAGRFYDRMLAHDPADPDCAYLYP